MGWSLALPQKHGSKKDVIISVVSTSLSLTPSQPCPYPSPSLLGEVVQPPFPAPTGGVPVKI